MQEVNKPNKLKKALNKIKDFWTFIWSNKTNPFYLLCIILFILLFFIVLYTNIKGGFFHINSDDVLQYYPYVSAFFNKIKNGTLSLYDTSLFGGTSFFSGVYYIPLDIFTFIAFIFSFLMEAEKAYAISNYLRPACGALLLYYVLIRKNMSVKTAFISSLILFVGGLTECYYIFPVYLGICFYAPLAMFVIDLILDKHGYFYLLIPLYVVIVIFYDYYIAYMLMAFFCIYLLMEMHLRDIYSLFGQNTFVINKNFWLIFLKFMSLILLGVLMSLVILLPSALYVVNETSRNNEFTDKSLWYFAYDDKFSIRHYFTQWINIFIPNETHRFCLNEAGDYMREHATMYITNGGVIYLIYLFFIRGKKEFRLKFWIILFNILFCIPLFSLIFSFNTVPYVRWFFIPYMINLYGMAVAMDKNDLKVGDNPYLNIFPMVFLILGLITIIYTLIVAPEYYIHYKTTDLFFYPILVGSAICIVLYLILLIISFIFKLKKKNLKVIKRSFYIILACEVIFAGFMIFNNAYDANDYYFNQKDEMLSQKKTLYNLGYNDIDGYRIHLDTSYAKNDLNANVLAGNVNFGHFFQSFYNTPLNKCLNDIYYESSTHWGRDFMGGNTLLEAPIWNTKYVVTSENDNAYFPSNYYTTLLNDGSGNYYSLNDCPQFIVYDSCFITDNLNTLKNALERKTSILYSAYIYLPTLNEDGTLYDDTKDNQRYLKAVNAVKEANVSETTTTALSTMISNYYISVTLSNATTPEGWSGYYYYPLQNNKTALSVLQKDVIFAYPSYNETRRINDDNYLMVLNNEQKTLSGFHNNEYFNHDEDIYAFAMKVTDDSLSYNKTVTLFGYDDELYTNFIKKQNTYTNKYYCLDGSTMKIKCDFPNTKSHIIKTAYTYSDDWVIKNSDYKLIDVDGGFLGIVIPENVTSVDITLKYEPAGFKTGLAISSLSLTIYLSMALPICIIIIKKRKRIKEGLKNEENNNNSSLL